jgi:hypothetical protein
MTMESSLSRPQKTGLLYFTAASAAVELGAEGASGDSLDDPDLLERNAEDLGHRRLGMMRALHRPYHSDPSVFGESEAHLRLQRSGILELRPVGPLEDYVGLCEPLLHVSLPNLHLSRDVPVRVDLDRVRPEGLQWVEDGWERVILDPHLRRGVGSNRQRVCDHGAEDVGRGTHYRVRVELPVRKDGRRCIGSRDIPRGKHAQDARMGPRAFRFDPLDDPMGDGRMEELGVHRPLRDEVGRVDRASKDLLQRVHSDHVLPDVKELPPLRLLSQGIQEL